MLKDKDTFGQPISKEKADELFGSYLKLKRSTLKEIKDAFSKNGKACRYYGCRNQDGTETFDIAFVFDKSQLKCLLDRIGDEGGLIFFNGIRPKDDNDDDGRPTLIAFPYYYETKEVNGERQADKIALKLNDPLNKTNLNIDADDDGQEHPGNEQLAVAEIKLGDKIPTEIPLDTIIKFT